MRPVGHDVDHEIRAHFGVDFLDLRACKLGNRADGFLEEFAALVVQPDDDGRDRPSPAGELELVASEKALNALGLFVHPTLHNLRPPHSAPRAPRRRSVRLHKA